MLCPYVRIYFCIYWTTSYSFVTNVALEEENDAVKERDDLRYERHKERERERRIARAAPERRAKLERARDRDVTEQIALGKPAGPPSQEALFDQRLFNQTKVLT